jgi:tetratricopeptide (TPR) repeat protein
MAAGKRPGRHPRPGGTGQKLADSAANDGPFQAELTRHYAEQGNNPLANAARTKARALFEKQLAKKPDNTALAWELADLLLIDTTRWTVLTPAEMKAEGGATLTKLEDSSILVSGPNPAQDVYTLAFRDPPGHIQQLRLEVLPHKSLPANGPGRCESGNFVLTTIKAQLDLPRDMDEPRSLTLARAFADFSQHDFSVNGVLDAHNSTGWAVYPEVGQRHFALFELLDHVPEIAGTALRVTLEFKSKYQQHVLGRFRLSVSADSATFDREEKRLAALKLSDPWIKLGTAYALNGRNDKASEYFGKGLQADPKLGDDRQAQHRYHAARAAVLAATGQGRDEPLDDAAKAKLRGQALDWLTAELTAWDKVFHSGPPQDRPAIVQTLNAWLNDADLADLRDAASLAKLPADEQQQSGTTSCWWSATTMTRRSTSTAHWR